jgi:hypothetical protein
VWQEKKRTFAGYDTARAARGLENLTKHKHRTERTWASVRVIALVVLQNLAEGRLGFHVWPSSSSGANVYVKVDRKEEANPTPTTSSGIKAVAEVSCVSVRWISQIQVSLVLRTFVRVLFLRKGDYADYV